LSRGKQKEGQQRESLLLEERKRKEDNLIYFNFLFFITFSLLIYFYSLSINFLNIKKFVI